MARRPPVGLLLRLKAVRLAAGDFEAAHLFKYQLCPEKIKERLTETRAT